MSEYPDSSESSASPAPQTLQGGYDSWLMAQFNKLSSRIASLETEVKRLATKDDVSRTKLWVLAGAIGSVIAISGVIFTILRYLDPA